MLIRNIKMKLKLKEKIKNNRKNHEFLVWKQIIFL